MQLNTAVQRYGIVFFAVFIVLVLVGFWPTYYAQPLALRTSLYHAHALTMTSWCALLAGQAYLARKARWSTHRRLGKLSFVLAPLVVVTGIALMHDVFQYVAFFEPIVFQQLFFFIGSAVVFAIFFVLAIWFRKSAALHARYMLCTVLPIYPPATDRLLSRLFPEDPMPILVPSWFAAELILLLLAVWDWRSHRRWTAFPIAFVIMLVYHAATFTVSRFAFWESFGYWFAS